MAVMSRDPRGTDARGNEASSRAGSRAARPRTIGERVRGRINDELNARKDRVTESLDGIADTVARMGEPLREPPYSALGEYVDTAAGRIRQLAGGLRERDVDELAHEVGEFARRRPAMFVGATLAAGIVAARFLKSSPERVRVRRRASTIEE